MDFALFAYCAICKHRVFQICLADESLSKCVMSLILELYSNQIVFVVYLSSVK